LNKNEGGFEGKAMLMYYQIKIACLFYHYTSL